MDIRIQSFSGIAPKLSRQLIPDNMARDARNCRLLSGELRGLHAPRERYVFTSGSVLSAVRLPDAPNPDIWLGFPNDDIDFLKGPLVNDAHERYYWTGDTNNPYVAVATKAALRESFSGAPPTSGEERGTDVDAEAASVVFLLGAEDALSDDSTYAHDIVVTGPGALSNEQAKWGSYSYATNKAAGNLRTPDYAQVDPAGTEFNFGTGDFTIEGWLRPKFNAPNFSGGAGVLGNHILADTHDVGRWYVRRAWGGTLDFFYGNGGVAAGVVGNTVTSVDTWNHFAITREGNTLRIFVNGTLQAATGDLTGISIGGDTLPLFLGAGPTAAYDFAGFLEDVRITKGVARYTSSFTAPAEPLPPVVAPGGPPPGNRTGVPTPSSPLNVASVTGGTLDNETRAYVFTFVNEFGEESAPSDPVLAVGPADGTWNLDSIDTTPPDMVNRVPAVSRRIYRTITGQSSALYYFVTELDNVVDTTFTDDLISSDVVQNNVCDTFNWDVPDDDILGIVAHPAGFMVGFKGRDLYFSEPYRPWAWPVAYRLSLEHNIVGLGIHQNSVMVMTESNPYYLDGTHPSALAPVKLQAVEPCVSKRSIVPMLAGIVYAGPNGLVLFNRSGANVVTSSIVSEDEWDNEFSPPTIKGAKRGQQYLGFEDETNGFEFSPDEPLGILSTLDRFDGINNIQTDPYTGDVYLISNNKVYDWDWRGNPQVFYTWRSKEFDFPRPLNLAAAIVKTEPFVQVGQVTISAAEKAWNTQRVARPLNPIGYTAIGASRWQLTPSLGTPNYNPTVLDQLAGYDRRMYSVGGSSLFRPPPTDDTVSLILNVYADRRLVATLAVRPSEIMRLPSGFKAHYWQFELIGNVTVYSMAFSDTGKGLMNV